jgi:predicted small secreted protein
MNTSRMIRAIVAIAFALGLSLSVSACNTVEGLGKDISAAGRALGADSSNRQN